MGYHWDEVAARGAVLLRPGCRAARVCQLGSRCAADSEFPQASQKDVARPHLTQHSPLLSSPACMLLSPVLRHPPPQLAERPHTLEPIHSLSGSRLGQILNRREGRYLTLEA